MTFGSLFAGIGGMDLGLERAGMECRWQVEIDPFCRQVLAKHWPHVKRYEDVRTVGPELERVDVIAGGFPCQDISLQGSVWGERQGLSGDRSGLWRHMLRIIRMVKPRVVLVENVAAILGNGFSRVLGDLAESGFNAEWDCLPAVAFGAPHERDRLILVAYDCQERISRVFPKAFSRLPALPWFEDVRGPEDLRERPNLPSPIFRGSRDGIPNWMDRLAGCGNAVVPQVAEWVGRRIMEAATA